MRYLLTDFDQRFTAFKAVNDLWQEVFHPMQQLRSARVTDSKPYDLRCLARVCHLQDGEVFILRHNHRAFSSRPLPNQTVGGGIHAQVNDMVCRIALRTQPSGEGRGELRVHQEAHQATIRTR